NPDEWDNIKYDYDYNMDPGGPIPSIARSSGFVLCTGIGIQWSLLKLEFIYARDFFDIDTINTVYLHERIHTYRLLVGIVLNPQ
ncbi:hypothetical protein JW935_16615, partial [candidate division KSB1 bacterium]|nr:hypothetical protein [candidate division KSB1 bacterium]